MTTTQSTNQPTARRSQRLARFATEVFAPWVWVLGLPFAVAWQATHHLGATLLWGLLVGITGSIIPMLVIVRGARRGKWDGHHVNNRAGRVIPLATCIGSLGVGGAILIVSDAPHEMIALAGALLAVLVIATMITFVVRWKISLHAAVAASTLPVLALVYNPWYLAVGFAVALVGWSRVQLKHHTIAQVLLGATIGLVACGLVYSGLEVMLRP